ncbi:GNAT family N-acetyltransferase [Vibrio ulleungensis]|jgi:GNAT superfamily N-acetyltransferase|uniref:GNAT family N-acetyltransferase n=1 Tax=Vibrio ulleungensis TaxID=2807619 RepID=A0ABS2HH52_9VIBR|nr:GNAT family N-acetyltransferase [Vibrio ulleungensis]MBM7035157.1 GNAT family N-acetyltransferase [Vibrio ulleungensis]
MNITLDLNPSAQDIEEIRLGLVEHNKPHLGNLREQPVACYCYHPDDANQKIAGVCGEIRGNWLMIQFLWVSPDFKHQGLGSKLLSNIEGYAQSLGCHSVLLDTFSFQARPFYEKHGYVAQMTLEKFPENHEKYFLIKNLSSK